MRLIRITSRGENAEFSATFNSDIILKPDSKIALQSVSINNLEKLLQITSDNNEITYQLNNQITRTIQLTPRAYGSSQILQLLSDIQNKLNDSSTFTNVAGTNKILGIEWACDISPDNVVNIQYAFPEGGSNSYASSWKLKGVSFSNSNNSLSATANTSVSNFTQNCILPFNMSRGNGYFRVKTNNLEGGNTKNGYIMGVYEDGDVTTGNLSLSKIKFGIRVDLNPARTPQRFYRVIQDGVEGTTEFDINEYTSGVPADNETQEIAINGDTIEINVYSVGFNIPQNLASIPINRDNTPNMGLNLKPVVAFFGSRTTTEVTMVRFLPSPFEDLAPNFATLAEDNVTAPARPANRLTTDPNSLGFQSVSLAQFLGYDNQRIPRLGTIPSPKFGLSYPADHEFNIPQEADAMLVQLLNLNLESYDSYADILESGGQRSNLLAVIPQTNSTGKIVYEPKTQVFLNLENKEPINLRNISLRVVREDYESIQTVGLNTVVLLID